MAKKKANNKKESAEAGGRSKKEIKEIKAFLKGNGWQEAVSHFKISPRELSAIKNDEEYKPVKRKKSASKPKAEKKEAPRRAPKKDKAKGEKTKVKAPKKTKAKSKKATEDAPWGYKADGAPKKRPGRKATKKKGPAKAAKKAAKKAAPKATKKKAPVKTKKAAKKNGKATAEDGQVLDYLLRYWAGPGLMLDEVIIDLTIRVREAA